MRVGFGAGLLAAAAALVEPGPAGALPPPAWQMDRGDQYCTLVRLPTPATPYATAFRIIPGTEGPSIVLAPGRAAPPPAGITAVALAPSGRAFDVVATTERHARGSLVRVLGGLDEHFWDTLAGATELQLKAGDAVRGRVALPGAAPAVAALRRCISQALRDWGVDEGALAALRERPITTNMFGMSSNDYPPQAIRSSTQGRVVVRVTVGPDGRATDCRTVGPSGSAALDATTCRVVMTRARFRPAIGADGQPTAAPMIGTVLWLVPGRRRG